MATERISSSPIHAWFGLSYAQFLTLPRVVMEAMPVEWQERMAALLSEMDAAFDWRPDRGHFWVQLRRRDGRFVPLPEALCDYRRGSAEHLRRRG